MAGSIHAPIHRGLKLILENGFEGGCGVFHGILHVGRRGGWAAALLLSLWLPLDGGAALDWVFVSSAAGVFCIAS